MFRVLAKILVLLFLVALLLALFAPSILSTQVGKHTIFRVLKKMTGYEIDAKELKLQWLKGQQAKMIDVTDKTGQSIFHANSLETSAPLWKIVFCHDVGQLNIHSPSVVVSPSEHLAKRLVLCSQNFYILDHVQTSEFHVGPKCRNSVNREAVFKEASFLPTISLTPSFKLLGEMKVTDGSIQFISPGVETISAKNVELDAVLLPKQIKMTVQGMTQESSNQGTFQIKLLAYPGSNQIDASMQIVRFPLRAADQLISILYPHMKGILRETIGESLDAELRLKNLQDNLEVYLNATSDHFSALLETKIQQDRLILASPALFQFQIPSQSFQQLTQLQLKNPWKAQIKIDELSVPLQNHQQFILQGTLKSERVEFENGVLEPFSLYLGNTASSENWNIKIDSSQVQFSGSMHIPQVWEELSFKGEALLPQNTKVDIQAESLSSIALIAQGDIWQGQFKGAIDPHKKTIALVESGFLTLQLANLPSPLPALLKEPLPIQISIEPSVINFQAETGSIKGVAEVPAFELGASHVDPTHVQFTGNIGKRQVQFSVTSKVDSGPLNMEGVFISPKDPGKDQLPFYLNLKGACQDFPIASIQPFLKNGPSLSPLFGETLTTHFEASAAGISSSLKIQAISPTLSLQAQFKTNQECLELMEPANFIWKLTPDGHQALLRFFEGSQAINLSDAVLFKGSIPVLSLPLDQNLSIDQRLNRLEYETKVSADQLSFVYNGQGNQVKQLLIELSHKVTSDPHQFQISAMATPQGTLSCRGNWMSSGTADIQLIADHFPTATFDFFMAPFQNSRLSFATLCGPFINLTLDTALSQWSGPLKLNFHSDHLRSYLNGSFRQGVLTLTDPFQLHLDLTPASSRMLFGEVNPLSLSSVRSEGPITLEITPDQFSYPLFPADISKIQVGKSRLELGKLFCKNEGNVQVTLGLLKLGQYQSGDDLKLWFAPLDFQIQNGVLNCERTELLIADQIQVCLWGNVDFPAHSIDAVLGLTASCLQKAFGIKDLPKNYVLQIPLRGTLTDVQINKGAATAKIGALLLWQQKGAIAGKAGGPAGAILGEMLNKMGPLPGGDQKAPPAKRPFPWESEQPKQTTNKKKVSENSHRKHFHPSDSALKQALKFIR